MSSNPPTEAITAKKQGRPRRDDIPTDRRACPEHGMTTFRRYRNGTKNGQQQYAWFCLIHRAEQSLGSYHVNHASNKES